MKHLRAQAALAAIPILMFVLCGQRPIPNSRRYVNFDYQFSVNIPYGLRGCMTSAPNPNHGVWIPLDQARCDSPENGSPYIGVEADYNTTELGNTAAALAAAECRWRGAKDIVWLRDATISGRKVAGCRRRFDDGHIEVTYIVLRKTGDDPLQWIEISADLITTLAP